MRRAMMVLVLAGCAEIEGEHVPCPVLEREIVAVTEIPTFPSACGIEMPSAVDLSLWRAEGNIDLRTGDEVCVYHTWARFGGPELRFDIELVNGVPSEGFVSVPTRGDLCVVEVEGSAILVPPDVERL